MGVITAVPCKEFVTLFRKRSVNNAESVMRLNVR